MKGWIPDLETGTPSSLPFHQEKPYCASPQHGADAWLSLGSHAVQNLGEKRNNFVIT